MVPIFIAHGLSSGSGWSWLVGWLVSGASLPNGAGTPVCAHTHPYNTHIPTITSSNIFVNDSGRTRAPSEHFWGCVRACESPRGNRKWEKLLQRFLLPTLLPGEERGTSLSVGVFFCLLPFQFSLSHLFTTGFLLPPFFPLGSRNRLATQSVTSRWELSFPIFTAKLPFHSPPSTMNEANRGKTNTCRHESRPFAVVKFKPIKA